MEDGSTNHLVIEIGESLRKSDQQDDTKQSKQPKMLMVPVQFPLFVCCVGLLIASLSINMLKSRTLLGLQLWKWFAFVLIICCSRLLSGWFINALIFLTERKFVLKKKKVLFLIYGLKSNLQYFVWFGSIMLAWGLLVDWDMEVHFFVRFFTSTLGACVFGIGMWILKNVIIRLLACHFHDKKIFDRIQDLIFDQYVFHTLSWGLPMASTNDNLTWAQFIWFMGYVSSILGGSGLSTICVELDKTFEDERVEQEAETMTCKIFMHMARADQRLHKVDLLYWMKEEDLDNVLLLFDGAVESRSIDRTSFKTWAVKVHNDRKTLVHLLNDTTIATGELNNIMSGLLLLSVFVIWLFLMGFATTQVLLLILSLLLALRFVFGNSCKTIFDGFIFVFVVHPFDKGDRCSVDNEQMVVEEIGIMTTVFLRENNDKSYYPNSLLATKAISNFNRSSRMGDTLELLIDVSTSDDQITDLKSGIKEYLESIPGNWGTEHNMQFKEMDDVKLKYSLHVTHTINFQNYEEKNSRRSELLFELKRLLEELGIKYYSLLAAQ